MDRASFFKTPLGLRQARVEFSMNDEDYVAWGKGANSEEFTTSDSPELFRLLEADEGLDEVFEVPFALKHVRDVLAVMRLSVAVAGERTVNKRTSWRPVCRPRPIGSLTGLGVTGAAAQN